MHPALRALGLWSLLALPARGLATTVTLAWTAPTGPAPDTYVLERNAVEVVRTPLLQATDTPSAAGSYRYTVRALTGDTRSEPSNALSVVVSTPPVSAIACTYTQEATGSFHIACAEPVVPPGTALPRWTGPLGIAASSEEVRQSDGRAVLAVDGHPTTIWHTVWSTTIPPTYPHWLRVDLGGVRWVDGLRYLPRQDSPNGRMLTGRVEVSLDNETWTLALGVGPLPNTAEAQVWRFPAVPARYVRLVGTQAQAGEKWMSAAEIGLFAGELLPETSP